MDKKIMKSGFMILLLILLVSCSSVEIRSPIVFKKPKPEEPPVSSQTASVPPSPQEAGVVEQSPVLPTPTPQREKVAVREESIPADTGITEKTPPQYESTTLSPASIPVLSHQDLAGYRFSVLGRIEVQSSSKEGFIQEKALQSLKVEAFKRYGSLAQGIINVDYKQGMRFLSAKKDVYEGISGDVITLTKKTAVAKGEGSETIPAATDVPGGVSTLEETGEIPQLSNIAILSSDDLFNLSFKILGVVTVNDESRKGFSEEQAVRGLKIEALRLYGVQAKALTKIKLTREQKVFYYKKTQNLKSPETPKGFIKASAEVVTWPSDSRAARP
jgi:hypothetical protein